MWDMNIVSQTIRRYNRHFTGKIYTLVSQEEEKKLREER